MRLDRRNGLIADAMRRKVREARNPFLRNIARAVAQPLVDDGPDTVLGRFGGNRPHQLVREADVEGQLPAQVDAIARKINATRFQLALAWLLHQDGILAIPKAASEAHVIENHKVLDIQIPEQILGELDVLFPPPRNKSPLAIL